jgi:spermidine synthase
MKTQSPLRQSDLGILFCFLLSGAAGLIYQVAWGKALGLIFGHTAYAISTVLAVFMAGLAAGSAWIGRWSESHDEPIALYAQLELLVAATGALSIAGLAGVRWLYVAAYPTLGGSQSLLLGLRFLGAAIVLFLPTFLMGGTFPVLVRGMAQHSSELGLRVSLLYWVNTLGAVAGTLLAGFVLLPACGLRVTIASAMILNALAALIARRIGKDKTKPVGITVPQVATTSGAPERGQSSSSFLLCLFAVVGGTAFAYEIAWTRLLEITIGSSTYAFTLMLATFLAGTVIGSALFQRFVGHSRKISLSTFSRTQTCAAIAAASSLVLFPWIASIIPPLLRATHQTFGGLLLAQFAVSSLTVLPLAVMFGFNFPAVVVLVGGNRGEDAGESAIVGKTYAANTSGAIVGALAAGFWLVPWLGNFRLVAFTAGINLLLAIALDLWSSPRRVARLAMNAACLGAVFFVGLASFFNNKSLLSLSAVLYGNSYQGHLTLGEIAATNDLVFATDGVNASISVLRSDNYVALRINGKTDASTGDARTQLLLGHLGAALHPAPRRVLIIGFGSGMTASAVSRYPDVEKIDCVEIEPAVIRAAPFLEKLNRGVMSDPRLHLIFDDARNFLLTSREEYDLIISEPSNPWITGIATLFTDEFYAAVRRRLAPGGMFVQWVQSYSLAPDDLRMVIGTLAPHFPDVTLWRGEGPDLLLLARTNNSSIQFGRLRSVWKQQDTRSDFQALDVQVPEGLVAYYLLDDAAVRRLAAGSAINTDDRTLLEYHAPQTLLASGLSEANQAMIAQFRIAPLPANLEPSETQRALEAGSMTALDLKDAAAARMLVKEMETETKSVTGYIAEGRLALMNEDLSSAKSSFETALRIDPNSPEAMHWLAVAKHKRGEQTSARLLVDQILKTHPDFLPALTDEMEFAADRKDFRIALLAQLNRMNVMTDLPASEYCRLGAIWMKMLNFREAEPVLLRGTSKDRYSYACHLELGELYRRTGQLSLARENFELVVRFYPDYDAEVFLALANVYTGLGNPHAAGGILRKGLRLFPSDSELQKAAIQNEK